MSDPYWTGLSGRGKPNPIRHAVAQPMRHGLTYRSLWGVWVHVDDIGSRFRPSHERACAHCRREMLR